MIDFAKFSMGDSVPKIIHQTFSDIAQLPLEIQENISNIRKLNRHWEYRLYDDSDIASTIFKHYGPEVLQFYQRINPSYGAARADFFRYLLMYAEGGVYLDIKSSVTRPLDDVIALDDYLVLSKWDNQQGGNYPGWGMHRELDSFERGEYQQWYIISVEGHPFLREVITRVINNIQQYNIFKYGVGRMGVLRVTGPIAYTLGIEDVKSLSLFREVDIKQDFGFEYSLYEANGKHKVIFRQHYSDLKIPVIAPESTKDFFLMILYSMWIYTKKMVGKIKF